jgi:DNA-binding XRE family transcriptional regulator
MSADIPSAAGLPPDYPHRIRQFRGRLGLTQVELAARLGVSFATVPIHE